MEDIGVMVDRHIQATRASFTLGQREVVYLHERSRNF